MTTHKAPLMALILSLVIGFSLIAFIQLEKNGSKDVDLIAIFGSPAFSNQPAFQNVAREVQSCLASNSTRTEVYDFIVANPGVQFRGICAGLGIAIGNAEFHLGVLKKAGLISFVRDGKYKRFFATKKFSVKEMKLISLLRHKTTRKILRTLATQKTVSHSKLASDLSITSQGLTWQMNRLRDRGIALASFSANKVTYSLRGVYIEAVPKILWAIES